MPGADFVKARRRKPVTIQGSAVELFEGIFMAFRRHLRDLFGSEPFDASINTLLDPKSYRIEEGPPRRVVIEPAALEAFHRVANAELGEPLAKDLVSNVLEAVSTLYFAGREVATRRIGGRRVAPPISDDSRSAIQALQKHTLFWIGNAYNQTISRAVNNTIEEVVRQGLDPVVGRDALKAKLGDTFSRTDAYWYVLAHAAMGRASNYGAVSRLREAEVSSYEFVAVIDEVTTPICRYMNGRVFRVNKAAEVVDEIMKADSPGVVRTRHAWLRFDRRRAAAGRDAIWFRTTDDGLPPDDPADDLSTRLYLPDSAFSLAGDHWEPRGSPKDKAVNVTLEQLGRVLPPLHGRCRSDVVISGEAVADYVGRSS